jgi:hypothetical protein
LSASTEASRWWFTERPEAAAGWLRSCFPGKGFNDIINVAGGFNAWTSEKAFLGEEKGVALFDGVTSVENALAVAYSLEAGLKEFYEDMAAKVDSDRRDNCFTNCLKLN